MATWPGMEEAKHPLRSWRDGQQLNLTAAAELLGLKKPALCRYEKFQRTPSLAQAAKLSEKTGIPIDQFVKQTEAAQ